MNLQIRSIDQIEERLRQSHYIADRSLATSIFLCLKLNKPLFLEGEAGVGKTEVGKILASMLQRRLIRLQCYEGLDINSSVYEWNYSRQMLQIRLLEASGKIDQQKASREIFGPEFLLERPLLQAINGTSAAVPVLLVDELDRADEEFEAFLLEVLSDFQITIPEIGTISAKYPPVVVITSNRTREIHDAIKRRCLYHWVDYPSAEREYQIILTKAPEAPERLVKQVVAFVQRLRREDLYKRPGVAETLDWVAALVALDQETLSPEVIRDTFGTLLKYRDDIDQVKASAISHILALAVEGSTQDGPEI